MSAPKHPDQPIVTDEQGVLFFKKNAIVEYLLDAGPFDLNQLSLAPFSREDRVQFAQLIGYSVDGFCDLPYVDEESKARAQARSTNPIGSDRWYQGLEDRDERRKAAKRDRWISEKGFPPLGEEPRRIVITKASESQFWYANRVGEVFEVREWNKDGSATVILESDPGWAHYRVYPGDYAAADGPKVNSQQVRVFRHDIQQWVEVPEQCIAWGPDLKTTTCRTELVCRFEFGTPPGYEHYVPYFVLFWGDEWAVRVSFASLSFDEVERKQDRDFLRGGTDNPIVTRARKIFLENVPGGVFTSVELRPRHEIAWCYGTRDGQEWKWVVHDAAFHRLMGLLA